MQVSSFLCPSDANPGNTGNFSSQGRDGRGLQLRRTTRAPTATTTAASDGPRLVHRRQQLADRHQGHPGERHRRHQQHGDDQRVDQGDGRPEQAGPEPLLELTARTRTRAAANPNQADAAGLPGVNLDPVGLQGRVLGQHDGGRGGSYWHIRTPNTKSCVAGSPWDGVVGASSDHSGGVNVLFLDGSVKFIKNSINYVTWTGVGTMNGGEVVGSDQL